MINRKIVQDIILQIIPVMIGVYLGFLVSNYAEKQKGKQRSKQLIENIISELKINKDNLQSVFNYHKMLKDSARNYSNPKVKMGSLDFFEGINAKTLSQSAYMTGLQTGAINELPLNQIQNLNQYYTFQTSYNEYGKSIINTFMNKDLSGEEKSIRDIANFLSVSMTDIVIMEDNLLKGIEQVTKELK